MPDNDPSDLVVLCQIATAVAPLRERFPSVQVIDISTELPDGARGDILFGGLGDVSRRAMDRGVRWVQMAGTGIDGAAPEVRGAPLLTSSRGASALAISEYVVATMAACARNFPANWLAAPPEHWNYQPARTLAGATLALFGFGGIAQRIARVALALEMSVVATRRTPGPSPVPGVEMLPSFGALLPLADHLVMAAPATDETRHILDADAFSRIKQGAHVVNIARGTLIDQDALRDALDRDAVARASLDVTDPEPLPAGHWLYEHPKVFLTPHASWVGPPAYEASTQQFGDNLARYLAGEPLEGRVDSGY